MKKFNLKIKKNINNKMLNYQTNYKLKDNKHIDKKDIIISAIKQGFEQPFNCAKLQDFLWFYSSKKYIKSVYLTAEEVKVDRLKDLKANIWLNYKLDVSINEIINFFINNYINNK